MSRLAVILTIALVLTGGAREAAADTRAILADDLSSQQQDAVWQLISQIYEKTHEIRNVDRPIASSGSKGRFVPAAIVVPGIPESEEQRVIDALTESVQNLAYRIPPSGNEQIRIATFTVTFAPYGDSGTALELVPTLLVVESARQVVTVQSRTDLEASLRRYILNAGYLCDRISDYRRVKSGIAEVEAAFRVACGADIEYLIELLPDTVMVKPQTDAAHRRAR